MGDCIQNLDPLKLIREGTSQGQRLPDALTATYVKVDEHEPADWMVFARRYAEYVRFFDINNQEMGDWRPFFEKDPLAILALAAVQNVEVYKSNISQYFKVLLTQKVSDPVSHELRPATDDELRNNFGHLFNAIGTLAWQLEQLKEVLPNEIALRSLLQNTIQSQLAPAFARLIGYFNAAEAAGLINVSSDNYGWDILGVEIGKFPQLYKNNFSTDWTDFYTATEKAMDDRIFGSVLLSSIPEKLNYAAGHNLFSGIFDLFVKAYSRTVAEAKKNLENTFTDKAGDEGRADHEPHYTLFLAFLRLLEYARDQINTLTISHLDFYYKEVLQLIEKPAEPNHAHLLFQLAKHKESHELKANTAFKAGKDREGKEIAYVLDEDFVPNIARVAELKSVYYTLPETVPALYAFPITNSDNGRGAELTSPDKQWHPFMGKTETDNLAQVGFAISSHYLLLSEGNRRIRLTLSFSNADKRISQEEIRQAFNFQLTGEKGWIPAGVNIGDLNKTRAVTVQLFLDGGQPPIVPLKTAVHGKGLPEGLPTLRATLKQGKQGVVGLLDWQDLKLNLGECELAVSVGYEKFNDGKPTEDGTGLKNLSFHNQFGEVKPDKPFQPFGPSPIIGDYLIIGCDEVFQKKNAKFQFRVVWKGLPDWRGNIDLDWVNEFFPNVSLTFLKNGSWDLRNLKEPDQPDVQIFFATRPDIYFPSRKMALPEGGVSEIHFDQAPYTLERRNGFLRMTLLADFGHKLYQPTLTRYLMRVAQDPKFVDADKGTLRDEIYKKVGDKYVPKDPYRFTEQFIEYFSKARPIEPYTPVIESLTLSYIASVKLNEEMTRMYWLTPFGYKPADFQTAVSLLPEFNFEGEFYIGVKDLKPPQNLSLLFQVAEGSANPTVKKPAEHVRWSYLRDNEWVDFKKTELSDATGQLTRSGIIRYSVPKDATKDDTLFLPTDCYWLRATVRERPDAVCKIITVTAQAARVTFKDQKNAPDFLSAQLPAETITKLVVPDAAVKKMEQPYPTFDGRPKEANDKFYTRVSERLRHKNRAISTWDYERLILEAFPHIYKVKCLNHTQFEPDDNGGSHTYNELAPGHVTIVTIPNLRNHNAIDPLRPYTNLGDLDLIEKFLEKHVSCFVKLHVRNPIFEIIRVDFRVKFVPGTDEAFHQKLLQKELVRVLSPWAFDEGKDITFGGKIYKSALIDFVEEQSYVDYVTDFQMFQPKNKQDGVNLEVGESSTAISILVSAAAEDHTVQVIPESETTVQDVECKC